MYSWSNGNERQLRKWEKNKTVFPVEMNLIKNSKAFWGIKSCTPESGTGDELSCSRKQFQFELISFSNYANFAHFVESDFVFNDGNNYKRT